MHKVVITLNSSWQAYNFRLNVARALKENGYKVIFIAPYDNKYSELLKKEFDFYDISIDPKGINPIKDFGTMVSLYKLYYDIRPDIILNFTIKPNIYSSLVARLLKIKVISNISGLGTIFIKQSIITKIAKLLYKIALSFNAKVFFQNNDDKNLFIENKLTKKDKSYLLPGSGVDLNKFIPIENQNNEIFKFLLIARLLQDKGIIEYIEAIKIIKKKYPNIRFKLLGSLYQGNPTAISNEELDMWINTNLIEYLGHSDNVKEEIEKVDCIVLPSYREGLSRVLLEAACLEKPIITTNVPGCKDVVIHGENGFLCEVKNSSDLATKIEQMINQSKDELTQMGKRGRELIIKDFDEQLVINKYMDAI